ncbi:DUF2306 domain-containing protein [Kordiimonas sp. SCSIO 12610]|uniref:DUF2306 domain-containing protein n=1 Tax=Kordiimonas sp. SCSIO 12610 TaxID=2829597 RepID=UPI00210A086A|nr:DUF2306 domain-containing protein [Kordiimonas sp. SCSIO 12610]UTW56702.1 DUF2306 domain-containing protein [Kordiimonas sp. SCSIO 12610]
MRGNMMIRKILWVVMTILAIGVAGYAFFSVGAPAMRNPFISNIFSTSPLAGYAHMALGGIAMLIGPFQFVTKLRAKYTGLHRWLGRTYVASVLLSAIAGFTLALTASGGLVAKVGFATMAIIWFYSATLAFTSIRAKNVEAHKRWMIRSYALTLSGVTLRVYLGLFFASGMSFSEFYPVLAWISWVPNLLIVEWFILERGQRA